MAKSKEKLFIKVGMKKKFEEDLTEVNTTTHLVVEAVQEEEGGRAGQPHLRSGIPMMNQDIGVFGQRVSCPTGCPHRHLRRG